MREWMRGLVRAPSSWSSSCTLNGTSRGWGSGWGVSYAHHRLGHRLVHWIHDLDLVGGAHGRWCWGILHLFWGFACFYQEPCKFANTLSLMAELQNRQHSYTPTLSISGSTDRLGTCSIAQPWYPQYWSHTFSGANPTHVPNEPRFWWPCACCPPASRMLYNRIDHLK